MPRKSKRFSFTLSANDEHAMDVATARYSMCKSDLIRMFLRVAASDALNVEAPEVVVLDRLTTAQLICSVNSLGYLLSRASYALDGIYKVVREREVDSSNLIEVLDELKLGLTEVLAATDDLRMKASEIIDKPIARI
jgi:hypothetical protein